MSYEEFLIDTYTDIFVNVIDSSKYLLSDVKPSTWAETHRVMDSEDTSRPGPFSYDYTPYLRDVVDFFSDNHPGRFGAVKKGAQIGYSTGVLENAIGWIIDQNPGNILFLSGHQELSEEAMNGKIDKMIDSCGLRHLIKPNVMRKRNQRTGDTSKAKEFPGGKLVAGSASNHSLLKQRSVRYGLIDDFDGAKKSSKKSGNTRTLIQQRFAAYYDKMKLMFISTPELEEDSNIDAVYKLGDQRKYHVECPCCGEEIVLLWTVEIEGKEGEMGGITWDLDENSKIVPGSVKYRCQKCGNTFDDSIKQHLLQNGRWIPTAEASEIGYYSWHISCLYAPPGMFNWEYYARQYLEANPVGGKRKEDLHKTFVNLCLGETYSQEGQSPEAKILQQNIRNYEIGTIPEKLSLKDGNGKIVALTCACDLNGTEQDARLDYEILAWAENDGACYSVQHGSIGTFVPRESQLRVKEDREHWTYEPHRPRNVWDELNKIIGKTYLTDSLSPTPGNLERVGRPMKIAITSIDTGHYTDFAYNFIDTTNYSVVGVRGDKESKYRKYDADTASFKPGRERAKLYLIDVNHVKDKLADAMKLKWSIQDTEQPPGFMNFPIPSGGLYLLNNYFSHFEAEHKVAQEKDDGIAFRWVKKSSNSQNHMWDVRVYNMALKDVIVHLVTTEFKIKKGVWADFCKLMLPK